MRDPRRYLHWVFEAKKRFGLCVLDYVVTVGFVNQQGPENRARISRS